MLGYNATAGTAVYAATKAAVTYFTDGVGMELKGKIDI